MKKYFSIQNHTLIRCFLIFQLHSWLKLIWCNTGITALQVFDCYSCIPCDIPNTVVRRRDCNFLDPGIKIDNRIHPEVCHPHEQISNPGTNVVYGIGSGGTNSQAPFPRRWHNTVTTFLSSQQRIQSRITRITDLHGLTVPCEAVCACLYPDNCLDPPPVQRMIARCIG